ncbi:MAG: ThuA domain-containing protein [Planctomycetota bacterium]|nr:ThuA domain-containing protein [Planctomycetota bacterium]
MNRIFFPFSIIVLTGLSGGLPAQQESDRHPVPQNESWLTYPGDQGPGKGKHLVLIAAEQEYRSEQSMPMLAKVLSKHHGFDCTVLFSVNPKGEVDPTMPAPFKDKTKRHHIPGLEHLAKADGVIWLSRFMHLPEDQLQHFHHYFDSGKPLIALRTANHGFWGPTRYQKDKKNVSLRELLGGTFMGHHGGWHREATRGVIVPENQLHPILIGVKSIWGTSDVYRCHNDKNPFPEDCTALVLGQPLINLEKNAPANPQKEPLPVAWTKTWTGNRGLKSRIFHFTMGSAVDFENEGVRRLTVNAVYWGLQMEKEIQPKRSVAVVGTYAPLKSGFNYEKLGVKPHKPAYYQ